MEWNITILKIYYITPSNEIVTVEWRGGAEHVSGDFRVEIDSLHKHPEDGSLTPHYYTRAGNKLFT